MSKEEDIPKSEKKIPRIAERLERVIRGVVAAINHYALDDSTTNKWQHLHDDLLNVPYHVFESHQNCNSYFCEQENQENEVNLVPTMSQTNIWEKMFFYLRNYASLAKSLVQKINTNSA